MSVAEKELSDARNACLEKLKRAGLSGFLYFSSGESKIGNEKRDSYVQEIIKGTLDGKYVFLVYRSWDNCVGHYGRDELTAEDAKRMFLKLRDFALDEKLEKDVISKIKTESYNNSTRRIVDGLLTKIDKVEGR